MDKTVHKTNNVNKHNRWGYIFLIPFIVVFVVFQLVPLLSTIYNSFFENYKSGLKQIGPNFIAFQNYLTLIKSGDLLLYFKNTMIMWVLGFVPQILVSLLLGAWFTDPSLRLKFQRFFKTVIYLPNLIMASAFSMLFFTLFSDSGPVNSILVSIGILAKPYSFMSHVWSVRGLVAMMNFLMWFGNTTILLMAGMMGIDQSLFEAAEVDGATARDIFFKITLPLLRPILIYVMITSLIGGLQMFDTLPLLRPILIYVMITSLIGGLQMFDVPQILTNGKGDPMRSSMTLIMYLNKHLFSKNYGMAGALSVILLIITGILSMIVFRLSATNEK